MAWPRNSHESLTTPGTITSRRDAFNGSRYNPSASASGGGSTPTISAVTSGAGKALCATSGDTIGAISRFEAAHGTPTTGATPGFYTNWGSDTTVDVDDRPGEVVLCFDVYLNVAWPGTTGNFTYARWGCDGRGAANPFALRYNNAASPTGRLQYTTWSGSAYANSTHTIPNGDHLPAAGWYACLIYMKPSTDQNSNDGVCRVWFGDRSLRQAVRLNQDITFNLADSQGCVYGKLDWFQVYANPAAASPTVSGAATRTEARMLSILEPAELALVDGSITLAAADFTSAPIWRNRNTICGIPYPDPSVSGNVEFPVWTWYDDGLWGTPVSVDRLVEVATDAAFTNIIDTISDSIALVQLADSDANTIDVGYLKVGHASVPENTEIYVRTTLTIDNGVDAEFDLVSETMHFRTKSRSAAAPAPWERANISCINQDTGPIDFLRFLTLRDRNDGTIRYREMTFGGDLGYPDEKDYATGRAHGGGSAKCQCVEDYVENYCVLMLGGELLACALRRFISSLRSDHELLNDAMGVSMAARFEGTGLVTPSTGWDDGWSYAGQDEYTVAGTDFSISPYGVWYNANAAWAAMVGGLLPRIGSGVRYDLAGAHTDPAGNAIPANLGEYCYLDTYATRTFTIPTTAWADPEDILGLGATKLCHGHDFTLAAVEGSTKPILIGWCPESLTALGPGGTLKAGSSFGRDSRVAAELAEILDAIEGNTSQRLSGFTVGDDHFNWVTRHTWAATHPRVGLEIGGGQCSNVHYFYNTKWPNVPASGALPGDQDPDGPMYLSDFGESRDGSPVSRARSACIETYDEQALTRTVEFFDLSEGNLAPAADVTLVFEPEPSGGGGGNAAVVRLRRLLAMGVLDDALSGGIS